MARIGIRSNTCLDSVDCVLGGVVREALRDAPDWLDFGVISGRRSSAEQQALFAKGRDENGEVTDPDKVVTYRNGISTPSRHQSGEAVDIMAFLPSGRGTFDERQTEKRSAYIIGFAAARGVALVGGVKWGWDAGHLELA